MLGIKYLPTSSQSPAAASVEKIWTRQRLLRFPNFYLSSQLGNLTSFCSFQVGNPRDLLGLIENHMQWSIFAASGKIMSPYHIDVADDEVNIFLTHITQLRSLISSSAGLGENEKEA